MMKKKLLSFIVAFTVALFAYSQATLPTFCDFSGSVLPDVGWTGNPENYYTASGNPAPAFKFQYTGNSLVINVASAPGTMTFDLTGNSFSGGKFEVQESVDGNNYSTVQLYDNSNIGTDQLYTNRSLQLSPDSRYIRFMYILKSAGNIGLDNVLINPAPVTEQQMEVLVDGDVITNNSTHTTAADVGNYEVLDFSIANNGSEETLEISSIVISGADAGQFSLESNPTFPLNVGPTLTEDIGIRFTPTSAGTKSATVTISSNDLDFPTFTFNLIGYGDGLATEPTAQPSNLSFSTVKTYRMIGSFSAAPNTDGYLILKKKGSPITGVPQDGIVYNPGDIVGDAKVVKSSFHTGFVPNDVVANTEYHYAIFSYNGMGQGRNYLTTNPLIGSQATPENMIPTADYAGINGELPTIIEDLHGIISPHYQNFYSDYAVRLVENFYARDTTNGKRVVTCEYTGNNYLYDYPFSFGSTGMSREHTFASSWFPISNNEANFYSDYHNLLLLHQEDANAIRSNYPLDQVVSDTIQAIGGSYFGKNAAGQWVYEPMDATKGAAARAMFYMSVRYTENGVVWKLPSVISGSINYGQDQDILKQWNLDFPPSNLEIARNDYIDSLQDNRNPFIDHPEYACFIDFSDMTHIPEGCGDLGISEVQLENELFVYPNPSHDYITISSNGININSLTIFDVSGREVLEENFVNSGKIDVSKLNAGTYFLTIFTEKGTVVKKVIKQ